MFECIDRVLLRVSPLAAAVEYYQRVAGLTLSRRDKNVVAFTFPGGGELLLHDDPDLPAEQVYYRVADVRDLHARAADLQLRFLQPPRAVARGYMAVVRDPYGLIFHLLDRTLDAAAPATAVEDARAPGALFAGVELAGQTDRKLLIGLYQALGRTADDLPYTPQFESLYESYIQRRPPPIPTRGEVWRQLLNLRKGGKLPRLGEAKSVPPQLPPEQLRRLRELLGEALGKRDRLPYTPAFEQLVDLFNASLPRALSPHLVWRLVATMAK